MFYSFDFWFTRNIGMAMPIICLRDQEVLLQFDTEKKEELIGGDNSNIKPETFTISNIKLRGEYIHLYGDEKRKFTNSSHEYLIEQLQFRNNFITADTDDGTCLHKMSYNLNSLKHPVKYMAWVVQNKGDENSSGMGPCYFTSLTKSSLYDNDGMDGTAEIKLNNISRSQELPHDLLYKIIS